MTSGDGGDSAEDIGCSKDPIAETFVANLTHKGDSGHLSFVLAGSNFNPPAAENNSWTLRVLDSSGRPIKDAVLSFPKRGNMSDPWMPKHPHGTAPAAATNNGDGTYSIASLYFYMAGVWSTFISAQSGSTTDSTTFSFCIGG